MCTIGQCTVCVGVATLPTAIHLLLTYLLLLTHSASQPPLILPDAMSVRVQLRHGVCVCLSVCVSQVGVLSKRMDGSSWLLAWRLLSTYLTLCYRDIPVSGKIKVGYFPFLLNFVLNVRYRKFRHSISIVETCYQLNSA